MSIHYIYVKIYLPNGSEKNFNRRNSGAKILQAEAAKKNLTGGERSRWGGISTRRKIYNGDNVSNGAGFGQSSKIEQSGRKQAAAASASRRGKKLTTSAMVAMARVLECPQLQQWRRFQAVG